jgi:hypothetical protein
MKPKKPRDKTLLKLFPSSDSISPCKNKIFGCTKTGTAAKLFLHQHICTFNAYSTTYNEDNFVRTLKTHGYLCRKLSYNSEGVAKFVSFNNSFLKDLGLQFLFRDGHKKIEIQAFTSVPAFQDISFRLVFQSDIVFTIKGHLNRTHVFPLPQSIKAEDIINYRITVSFKDEPIVVE